VAGDWGQLLRVYPPASLDDQSELCMPEPVARRLEGPTVLAPTLDTALALYSRSEWELLLQRFEDLDQDLRLEARAVISSITSAAVDCPIENGRITVPPTLRRRAGIVNEVVLAAGRDHLEIWSPEGWEACHRPRRPKLTHHDVA